MDATTVQMPDPILRGTSLSMVIMAGITEIDLYVPMADGCRRFGAFVLPPLATTSLAFVPCDPDAAVRFMASLGCADDSEPVGEA